MEAVKKDFRCETWHRKCISGKHFQPKMLEESFLEQEVLL